MPPNTAPDTQGPPLPNVQSVGSEASKIAAGNWTQANEAAPGVPGSEIRVPITQQPPSGMEAPTAPPTDPAMTAKRGGGFLSGVAAPEDLTPLPPAAAAFANGQQEQAQGRPVEEAPKAPEPTPEAAANIPQAFEPAAAAPQTPEPAPATPQFPINVTPPGGNPPMQPYYEAPKPVTMPTVDQATNPEPALDPRLTGFAAARLDEPQPGTPPAPGIGVELKPEAPKEYAALAPEKITTLTPEDFDHFARIAEANPTQAADEFISKIGPIAEMSAVEKTFLRGIMSRV